MMTADEVINNAQNGELLQRCDLSGLDLSKADLSGAVFDHCIMKGVKLVEATLEAAQREGSMAEPQSVDDAIAIDHNARRLATDLLPEIAAMAS